MMVAQPNPYIQQKPGDLITAENWNQMQIDVRNDIQGQISTAVGQIKHVDSAADAHTLDSKTLDQIGQEILDKVLRELPRRQGYRQVFKRLETGKEELIAHKLKACPLVDVYQLDYFEVVCATGETSADLRDAWVNFYLYHAINERRFRLTGKAPIDIESADVTPYRVRFADMLDLYEVQYTDDTTLDELETAFWTAFFTDPNDEFDADQYCHSPWFEKCCGEKRRVTVLKSSGDWNNMYLKMLPRKTINYPTVPPGAAPPQGATPPGFVEPKPAPTQINVAHHDFDTFGITLLASPNYPDTPPADAFNHQELKVMLLLKV